MVRCPNNRNSVSEGKTGRDVGGHLLTLLLLQLSDPWCDKVGFIGGFLANIYREDRAKGRKGNLVYFSTVAWK